jgi:hypothetical protein
MGGPWSTKNKKMKKQSEQSEIQKAYHNQNYEEGSTFISCVVTYWMMLAGCTSNSVVFMDRWPNSGNTNMHPSNPFAVIGGKILFIGSKNLELI